MSSNPIREITRLMDKRAKQPQEINININASGPTGGDATHNHDDRYYREGEVDTLLSGKSNTTHNHDSDYADIAHSHTLEGLSDVPAYTGIGGKILAVKATEDGVEFVSAGSGSGDMTKAVYDTDDDGIVDAAENALAIDGKAVDLTGIADGYILYYDSATGAIKGKLDEGGGGGGYTYGWNSELWDNLIATTIDIPT